MSPLPLFAKPKKGKSHTVTPTLPKSQGPKASGALYKKRQKPKSKNPPTKTKVIPPKLTEGSEQSHSVSSGTVPDPQDLERNIQLASTGLPSTLDEGTRKSQPLTEGPTTHPKNSWGNIQPLDRDLTSMTCNEGTAKTMSRLEGLLGDKDSGGNKPPANMEPINPTVADPSGIGAKYLVDQTQSTRLRYQSMTENKGKPSHEGELDTQPLVLSTYVDVRAFLLFDDKAQESEEDILGAGEEMDEDSQAANIQSSDTDSSCDDILKKYDNTLPLTKRQLVKYLRKVSTVLLDKITEDSREKHQEAVVNYANLKASIDDYYDENIAHRNQTDKLVEVSISSLDKSSTTISDLYKGLDVITQLLKDINNDVKDDLATNMKIDEAVKTFSKIPTQTTEIISLVKTFDFSTLHSQVGPRIDKGKGIATNSNEDPSKKLVLASTIIHLDPDEKVKVPYMINGKLYYLANKEEAKKLGINPKEAISTKAGEQFKKAQDAEHEVLKREHSKKVKRLTKLNKRRAEEYMWTITNKIKPEPITNIKIHPNTKPVVVSVFWNNDKKNFDVHNPFKFTDFGINVFLAHWWIRLH
ncbi:hypothetical protein Tco_0659747 [Tanacetum coccineum]